MLKNINSKDSKEIAKLLKYLIWYNKNRKILNENKIKQTTLPHQKIPN